jgi:hypothetical protein
VLLAASASLEWTAPLPVGRPGRGRQRRRRDRPRPRPRQPVAARLRRLGRALDRVARRRRSLALRFSWLRRRPIRSARRSSRCARAGSSGSSAPRTRASAPRRCASATRVVEVEHELQEQHLPIVIEPTLVDVPKSTRVVKERQKPLFSELVDTKLPQVDLLDSAPQRVESVSAESLEMTSRLIEKRSRTSASRCASSPRRPGR